MLRSLARTLPALVLLVALVPAPVAAEELPSLYSRLGGYDAIAAVTDEFIGRLLTDPDLAHFFVGHSTDSKERIRQHVVDQLCAATGGPCVYKGRDMKTSHAGLGITGVEWDRSVEHLVATFEKFRVRPALQDEMMVILSGIRDDIVEIE